MKFKRIIQKKTKILEEPAASKFARFNKRSNPLKYPEIIRKII